MSDLTHENRQSILNRIFSGFIVNNERMSCSVVDFFDWNDSLVYIPGDDFIEKLTKCPECASTLFDLEDDSGLDNDGFAFLIDLEAARRAAVDTAKVPLYGFDRSFHDLDAGLFRFDLKQRLDRIATHEGLDRPASALLSS